MNDAVTLQRSYYDSTAAEYDQMHLHEDDEHYFALAFLSSCLRRMKCKSVLDVGSGTGRAPLYFKQHNPGLTVCGLEPSANLRSLAYDKGLTPEEMIDGDAQALSFPDNAFDVVCEFSALHHMPRPDIAVSEMLRVAKVAIFISDINNFGHGLPLVRAVKQAIDWFGLWHAFNLIKTRGKGYWISPGDGLAYSYSVFNNYKQIKRQCRSVHLLNTSEAGINPYRTASHIALLGVK